ncbi:MAG: PqqD family protein, partial [Actinobacteria bacterium]|nr:PqqD family protein [Actinomycetota bacterium]
MTLEFVPAPAPGVESCMLDGQRLVWQGAVLRRLDPVGALVWDCFDGTTTLADLSGMLAEDFQANEHDVQRDISALCAELLAEGFLAGGRPKTVASQDLEPIIVPPSAPLDPGEDSAYTTARFRALDHDFAVRTDDARLAAHFDRSLRSFAASGSPARWYSVVAGREEGERYRIYLDGEGLYAASDADAALRYVLWHVNYQVIVGAPSHLLIHASAATLGGQAIVMPGEPNAGKTTLVSGLVLDGLKLLTDELAALNLATGLIDPYPRPLNIGQGSWEVLAALRPVDRDDEDPLPELSWAVAPSSIGPDAVAAPAPLR